MKAHSPDIKGWIVTLPIAGKRWRKTAMAHEQKPKPVTIMPRKTAWHLYSLQNLEGNKLVEVVNKVLRRELQLVK